MEVLIRTVTPDLAATWEAMRRELWPGSDEHASEIAAFFEGSSTEPRAVFSAHDLSGAMIGFAELSIRLETAGLAYQQAQAVFRRAQRRVARRKKGSSRRRKAVVLLRKLHEHIANKRSDFLHKHSTAVIRQYGTIGVEALNVAGYVSQQPSKTDFKLQLVRMVSATVLQSGGSW